MRNAGLRGKTKRKFKTTTTSQHSRPKTENLVEQNFDVANPNTLWASDITYVPTAEGWLYLAVTLDLFSRKVVGWAFSDRLTDDLTLAALAMATRQRPDSATLTHHSDQGSQYASHAFRAKPNASSIRQSMSGSGNCYDNAVVESFFATLKTEEVEDAYYKTRQQAKTSIFSYLECFYNAKRRHSSLGFLSPTILRGCTSLKLLNCDSVKAGKDQCHKTGYELLLRCSQSRNVKAEHYFRQQSRPSCGSCRLGAFIPAPFPLIWGRSPLPRCSTVPVLPQTR